MVERVSYRRVINTFSTAPPEVQNYFVHFPQLSNDFPWEISLAYLFLKIEQVHHMSLYCGVVKLHKVNATLTDNAIQNQYITREIFLELFEKVFSKRLDRGLASKFKDASLTRNKVLHGKIVSEDEKKRAIIKLLEYATGLNEFVSNNGGFSPMGNLRGFKGRQKSLDKSTSRWILKGMGFNVS